MLQSTDSRYVPKVVHRVVHRVVQPEMPHLIDPHYFLTFTYPHSTVWTLIEQCSRELCIEAFSPLPPCPCVWTTPDT
jgi:hypothetical protein